MLWDYGRMAGGTQPGSAARALNLLIASQPERTDVRLALARIQLNQKQAQEALETLNPIKRVSAEDAAQLFQLQAYGSLETGNRAMARAYAKRWIENTQDTNEKVNANRILRYLDDLENAPARAAVRRPPAVPPPPSRGDETPRLARREGIPNPDTAVPAPVRPGLPSVNGTFVELNCQNPKPVFVLQTVSGRVSLAVDDPEKIEINGNQGQVIDLNCGPQKSPPVRIEFEPAADQTGIAGVVRRIYFEAAQ